MSSEEDPQEQRRHRRLTARLDATLVLDGGVWRCVICDISPGGAGLAPAMPATLGRLVELRSPHFARPLLGRVVNVATDRTHLAFELDESMQYELAKFLATHLDLT